MPSTILRDLFVGELALDALVPFPRMPDEDAEVLSLLRDALARFARDAIDPVAIDKEHRIPDAVMDGLAELGVFGLLVPEEFGGLGFSQMQYAHVCADLMAYDGSVAIMAGGHSSIGMKALLRFGTDEQKERYLPRLATGELKAAFALSEAGSGTDAQAMKTVARRDPDGDGYVLNGEKLWITNGGFADLFTVFALTPDHERDDGKRSITAFLVERDFGVVAGPDEDKLGLLGSSTVPIRFEDARVPARCVLGEPGRGFSVALSVLNEGRLGLAGNCLGASRFLLEQAAAYTAERQQFGRPIGSFELIREKLGRMALDVHSLDAMLFLTAGLTDRGDADIALEAAACKVFGTETLWSVVNDAMQCAGGNGFTTDYPYERMLRDARVNMIFEGTNEILRVMIARAGLAAVAPRAAEGAPDDGPGSWSRRASGAEAPEVPDVPAALNAEAVALSMGATGLAKSAAECLRRHGDDVGERQLALAALADQAIALYGLAAVLSRARDADGDDEALRIARGAARRMARRARAAQASLGDNDDDVVLEAAAAVAAHGGLPRRAS